MSPRAIHYKAALRSAEILEETKDWVLPNTRRGSELELKGFSDPDFNNEPEDGFSREPMCSPMGER